MRTSIYNSGFARVYNERWADFANTLAPRIRNFYEQTLTGKGCRDVLDICCGTGQLALHFLERGYRSQGLIYHPQCWTMREATARRISTRERPGL